MYVLLLLRISMRTRETDSYHNNYGHVHQQ